MVKRCNVLSIHRLNLEGHGLRDRLLLPHEKTVEQEEKVVQVTCNVEHGPPLDKANVVGVLR